MRGLKTMLLLAVALVIAWAPEISFSQRIIYTVCRQYVVEKNCYRCSSHFAVQTESEAQKKCKRWGADEDPYYFPTVGAVFSWKLPNCTCGSDRGEGPEDE
jgi:hypothetical protein